VRLSPLGLNLYEPLTPAGSRRLVRTALCPGTPRDDRARHPDRFRGCPASCHHSPSTVGGAAGRGGPGLTPAAVATGDLLGESSRAALAQEIHRCCGTLAAALRPILGRGQVTAPAIDAEIGAMGRCPDADQLVTLRGPAAASIGGDSLPDKDAQTRRALSAAGDLARGLDGLRLDPMFRAISDLQRQRGRHHLVALAPQPS
jgi:hypothetical protein